MLKSLFFPALHWYEPKAYRIAREAVARARPKPWMMLIGPLILVPIWWLGFVNYNVPLWGVFSFGILLGWFAVYGKPWVMRKLPARVGLYAKGLQYQQGDEVEVHAYSDMTGYLLVPEAHGTLLQIMTKKGDALFFGIPPKINVNAVRAFLEGKGVPRMDSDR